MTFDLFNPQNKEADPLTQEPSNQGLQHDHRSQPLALWVLLFSCNIQKLIVK